MIPTTYVRLEILRTVRNRRFFIFSLVFPLVLYLAVVGANRHTHVEGIPFSLYYLTGMVAFGTMIAQLSSGGRIAAERTAGWTRQMRITPLHTRAYFATKVLTGYMMAAISIVLLYAAGVSMGVHLSAPKWLMMTGLILVGLIPFAVLGILVGHLVTPDSLGPALGGGNTLLSLVGGAFGPLSTGRVYTDVVKCVPSYWLVQAGKSALTGNAWPIEAWIVVAVWTVILIRLAAFVYGRDTARV